MMTMWSSLDGLVLCEYCLAGGEMAGVRFGSVMETTLFGM